MSQTKPEHRTERDFPVERQGNDWTHKKKRGERTNRLWHMFYGKGEDFSHPDERIWIEDGYVLDPMEWL